LTISKRNANVIISHESGGMAEWSKAAVLKTVEGNTSVGSNPTPSANKITTQFYLSAAANAAAKIDFFSFFYY
jgi:hypothetical protein